MYWFNGSITITMKDRREFYIWDIPFDANIQTRIDHEVQNEGYSPEDVQTAQYFPSTMTIISNQGGRS